VARAHQFAIVRRQGDWEVVETLELKQARAEIKKLNEELEQRVVERTGELAAVNEKLRDEVAERKRAQERLQEYEKVVEGLDEMIVVVDREFRYLIANRAFLDYRGVEKEQLLGHFVSEFLDGEIFEKVVKKKFNESLQGKVVKYELKYTYPKLGERDLLLSYFPIEGPDGVDRVACVLRDITDRKRAEELLRATSEQLRALSARLQSAREEEGARIAREIHDELGSALTTLKWDLETIDRENVEARDNADLGSIREKIAAMMQLIDTTTHTMKRISSELRPSILDDIGLVEAIDWQTQQFQTRTGIICNCDCGLENVDITQEQSTAIFRIFQEALTNILRHAQATQVDVAVKHEAGELVLTIKDNGRGISDEEKTSPQSLGLLGMRERVSLIGGQIDITGAKGEGTVATVRVPLFN
jgi:PAS domain S-box-containing protein